VNSADPFVNGGAIDAGHGPRTTVPYLSKSSVGAGVLRVRSTGVDTLNLAAKGPVRKQVWELVGEAKAQAQTSAESELIDFPVTGQAFLLKPHGVRGYTYWLSSPDFELMLGTSEKFPAVLVQMHSAYMHSMGVDGSLRLVEQLLGHDVFAGPYELMVSRIDLYADFQGWTPELTDLRRFVGFGRHRRGFEERQQTYMTGSRLTGFMFGKDVLVGRIYDKTVEIRRRGLSWLPDLWGADGQDDPIWRLEFQYRRAALVEFNLRTVGDVLAAAQDLWRYATEEWLTLRTPTSDRRQRRWPVDPVWEEIRDIRIAPGMTGVVRRRLQEADELRLVQGFQGYASSLAARRDRLELGDAMEDFGTLLRRYLESRGREFTKEVARKQSRQLGVTAFVDEDR
jgi:hypothetical protein